MIDMAETMKALVYKGHEKIVLEDRPMPVIKDERDAIVKVTLSTICSSDLHILHGTVPRANEDIVLGHEFVGEVVETGSAVKKFKKGDRVSVSVETWMGAWMQDRRMPGRVCARSHRRYGYDAYSRRRKGRGRSF